MLWWIGQIVEGQVGVGRGALIYFVSVLLSAIVILLVHNWHPKAGATVGASGGVFGLLAAALTISYRENANTRLQRLLWIVLLVGFGVSFLPTISMAGHIGGIIGAAATAFFIKLPKR